MGFAIQPEKPSGRQAMEGPRFNAAVGATATDEYLSPSQEAGSDVARWCQNDTILNWVVSWIGDFGGY